MSSFDNEKITTEEDAQIQRVRFDLARTRQRVATSIVNMRAEVGRLTEWRGWVERAPLFCVGATFVFGFIVGRRLFKARSH